MTDQTIIDMTRAYLLAYKVALQETKNSNLAVQIAMCVTNVICINAKNDEKKQEKQPSPWDLFGAAFAQAVKKNTDTDPEEGEDSEE